MSIWSRIANLFRSDRVSGEIDEELDSHVLEAIRLGRNPAEVRRTFGSSLQWREHSRDIRLIPWLDSLRADAVVGWRRLNQTKATTAAAILSLALATGACTATFRLIDALFLRPLPVANPDRLHVVAFQGASALDGAVFIYDSSSYPMFRQMRDVAKDHAELMAVSYAERADLTFTSDLEMEKAYRQFVSGSMFEVFGLRPALGRLLSENDDRTPGAHPVLVISHDYWKRRLGADPDIVGRTLRMEDDRYEIIGVAPPGFTGTETGTMTDLFVPIMMKNPRTLQSANNFWLRSLVQLKPGADPESVRQQLAATFRAIQLERAKGFTGMTKQQLDRFFQEQLVLEPAAAGRSNLQRDYRQSLQALGVLVALVLLIACANVANLMTARAAARAREMALRVSIGAGRRRLVQLVLMESALLAGIATIAGALFASWSAPFVVRMINTGDDTAARLDLPADWRVLGFALALTLFVTVLFGLPPALRASSVKPAGSLRGGEDPHARRRLMHALIAVQVTFCFLVLFVAGLFVTSFDRLSKQPLGYSPHRILNLESLSRRAQPSVYWDQVADHLRTVPGVESVALSGWPMMSGESSVSSISIGGAPPTDVFADFLNVSPGWCETLKIPLLGGRDLRPGDTGPGVAIVNQAFAKQYFDGTNPVGKFFEKVDGAGGRLRVQIVGYVADARYRDRMRLPVRPTFFAPLNSANPLGRATFVVRTAAADPLLLAPLLRQEVPRARPEIRVSNIRTQAGIVASKTIRERLLATMALFFAIVAVLLAGVGLYGVLDYSVLQQRREIGIRMAIGAQAVDIARRVAAEALAMVLAGAIAGLALGTVSVRYVESLVFGVRATGPGMLLVPSLAILVVAMLAASPAVIRAVRIDPVRMLRVE